MEAITILHQEYHDREIKSLIGDMVIAAPYIQELCFFNIRSKHDLDDRVYETIYSAMLEAMKASGAKHHFVTSSQILEVNEKYLLEKSKS